jgi:AcrR family transcriptional regulator
VSDAQAIGGEAASGGQRLAPAVALSSQDISYNLNGQRLGRKGRETRERIVRAAIEVLGEEGEEPFTLSAVARQASLGMSSLYNYFTDLSELMVAVLEPVTASARETWLAELAHHWPDAEVAERCEKFWQSYAAFWSRNAPVLHQRNRMSDAGDERMLSCRVQASQPLTDGIAMQLMAVETGTPTDEERAMAGVLVTMMERSVTVQSQPNYRKYTSATQGRSLSVLGAAGARLLMLAVRDCREAGAKQG